MSASWQWCVWVGRQEERTPSVRVLLDTPVVDVLLVGPIFRISLAIHYCIVGHVWRKTTWLPLTLLRVWGLRTKTKKLAHLKELLEFWVKIVSKMFFLKISGLNPLCLKTLHQEICILITFTIKIYYLRGISQELL